MAKLALEDLNAVVLTFEMLFEITSIDVWLARIPEAAMYKPCVIEGVSLFLSLEVNQLVGCFEFSDLRRSNNVIIDVKPYAVFTKGNFVDFACFGFTV